MKPIKATESELNYIKKNYIDLPSNEIARRLGRSPTFVRSNIKRMGLIIPEEILEARRKSTRFKKGMTPHSKGKKQVEWMSKSGIEQSKKTRFQNGSSPKNKKPIGYKMLNVRGYVEVKVAQPDVFEYAHRLLWEKHHGKVPDDHVVCFKDGNKLNITIENLECISNAEHMKKNSFVRYPAELRRAIKMTNSIRREIKKNNQIKEK